MARISVGTVTPVPKGDYSPTVIYNRLNLVKHNGTSYCCKVNGAIGISPENTEIWMKMLDSPENASGVSYDNSTSGLEATKVQGAIDEVVADLGETTTALNDAISATQEMNSDEWKSGSTYTYKAGEYKIYNNVIKKCLIDCNGSVSFDNDTYWTSVRIGEELYSTNRTLLKKIEKLEINYASSSGFSILIEQLEASYQGTAQYSLFSGKTQAGNEAGWYGFKHADNKPSCAVLMSRGAFYLCTRTSGVWRMIQIV